MGELAGIQAELVESRRALKTLLSNLPGMAYRCRNDPHWSTEFVSDGCLDLTGYAAEAFTSGRISYNDLIEPEDREWLWADTQAAIRTCRPFQQEYRIRTAAGAQKWVWEQGQAILGPGGEVLALEGFVQDITDRKQAVVALQDQAAQLAEQAHLLELAHDAIVVWELGSGAIRFWNRGAESLYGWPREAVLGLTPQAILNTLFPQPLAEINHELTTTGRWEGELSHVCRDGSRLLVASRWALERATDGRPACVLAINRDISARKRAEADLAHQAQHDALTQLPNRVLLRGRVESAIEAARASGVSTALLMLDLDGFKEVNDTFGHDHGDRLLQEVSRRLLRVLDGSELVARLGGDEFAVLLTNADAHLAQDRAAAVLAALDPPFRIEGHPLLLGASIGVALAPAHGTDFKSLLRRADVAMYEAKEQGGGCVVYSPDRDRHRPDLLGLLGELRQAIESEELVLHYQPKVNCATGAFVGVEALVRWPHPQRGMIPPDQFIPQAERSGLIHPLTRSVIRSALRQTLHWRQRGLVVPVAVNLSMRSLHDPELPGTLRSELAACNLPGSAIELEITESSLMADPARALAMLMELNEMGVRIAIDDFGTGYSSLAYLKDLPVHELKIDRCFVRELARSPRDLAIVQSTIDLAHHLGLRVVAEGVEDAPTAALLAELGCDLAQGYHFSRPLPAAEVSAWAPRAASGPTRLDAAA
jgi:diguanylate cyclase (GGDEF)-like protein/PAS domain S-box-containing protein